MESGLDRRAALAALGAGSLAALAGRAAAQGAPQDAAPAIVRIIHIHATEDGGSAVEILTQAEARKDLPAPTRMLASAYSPAGGGDWHTAPGKTFSINMTGALRVETTDSPPVDIGPGDLVYLSDLTGKGHVTRSISPVANIFLFMPDDFDIRAWCGPQS